MKNDAKDVNETKEVETIGCFSAVIEKKDLDNVREIMRAHSIHMQVSNSDADDDWWFFLLPKGSTRVQQEHQGSIPRYTIRLADEYSFTLEVGPRNREGYLSSPPRIFFDESAKEEVHRESF